MTPKDIETGVKLTLQVAHDLRCKLGRTPAACETRWRLASVFQARWTTMDRCDAVRIATQMMQVVATAAHKSAT